MARGWRKDPYDPVLLARYVKEILNLLGRPHRWLAEQIEVNEGTISHVVRGDTTYSVALKHRERMVDVLVNAANVRGFMVDRKELIEAAGLARNEVDRRGFLKGTFGGAAAIIIGSTAEAGMGRGNAVATAAPRSTSEVRSALVARGDWREAATSWRLEADRARHRNDVGQWARALLQAGQMELNLGQHTQAEERFREVLNSGEVGSEPLSIAESHIRLGWLAYEQDRLDEAERALQTGIGVLATVLKTDRDGLFKMLERDRSRVYDDPDLVDLLSTGLHFLASTEALRGLEGRGHRKAASAMRLFEYCYMMHDDFKHGINMGFELLGLALSTGYSGETDQGLDMLARGQELLPREGPAVGNVLLTRGRVRYLKDSKQALELFRRACEHYRAPVFYSTGVARALQELSALLLEENRSEATKQAFEYALIAMILHPWGRQREMLQQAAYRVYREQGRDINKWSAFRCAVEEKLWRMDEDPFLDVARLVQAYGYNDGMGHLKMAAQRADKAIDEQLGLQ